MNIFYKIDNSIINNKVKEDFEKASKEMLDNIENIFKNINFESIINKFQLSIIFLIEEMGKSFKFLMKSNNNDLNQIIKNINIFINDKIDMLKEELTEELGILQEKIWIEVEKIGVTILLKKEEKIKINEEIIPLGIKKITETFLTVFDNIIALPKFLALEIPSFLIKKIVNAVKNEEQKFKDYLETCKEKINESLKIILNYFNSKVNEFKISIIDNSKRVLGLIEVNSIETDDFWNETKKYYEKIYENYKDIKDVGV